MHYLYIVLQYYVKQYWRDKYNNNPSNITIGVNCFSKIDTKKNENK